MTVTTPSTDATVSGLENLLPEDISESEVFVTLKDTSIAIGFRMRCLFVAMHIGGRKGMDAIVRSLDFHPYDEVLYRHEACYALGQMGPKLDEADRSALLDVLEKILADLNDNPVTRHEAAEAMGNFGGERSVNILRPYLDDAQEVVRETVYLALHQQEQVLDEMGDQEETIKEAARQRFFSHDPECPFDNTTPLRIPEFADMLNDRKCDLKLRYKALFSLRDLSADGHMEATESILSTFDQTYEDSVLFMHEVAFVAGQVATPAFARRLIDVTLDSKVNAVIRHEAAMALGAIAVNYESLKSRVKDDLSGDMIELVEILGTLKKGVADPETLVKDSCLTALYNFSCDTETKL